MSLKTKIIEQYLLPYEVSGCLALSNEMCVVLGCDFNEPSKFLLINSGKVEILNYDIPLLKWDISNYRCALYKTPDGFGAVLDHEVVEYNFESKKFKIYPISGSSPIDEHNRETGPLGNAVKINETEILVNMEDYAGMGRACYFTKLTIVSDYVERSTFMFAINKYQYKNEIVSSTSFINNQIVFHRCEFSFMNRPNPKDLSELCAIRNGSVEIIAKTSKGIGRFSSDKQYLMVKTFYKPIVLEFYSLDGNKIADIPLTPKKVIGEIDKRFLEFFDKHDKTLWMGRNNVLTQAEFTID